MDNTYICGVDVLYCTVLGVGRWSENGAMAMELSSFSSEAEGYS